MEARNSENPIHFYLLGAFPLERAQVFRQAAECLQIPYEEVSNTDPRIDYPNSFVKAQENEQVVFVDYGQRHRDFWEEVNRISPPIEITRVNESPETVTPVEVALIS